MLKRFIGDRAFYKKLLAVMLPVLLQNVITNFVSLLDNIMVGRVGTEQMSGVAIVNQLLFIFNLSIFGGIAGPGIFTAQFFGAGDDEGVRSSMRAKLWVAGAVTAAALALFLTKGQELISLFIHEGEDNLDLAATLAFGRSYLKIMFFQMPLFALLNVYSGTLRETGETKLPMKAGIIAVLVNLTFNYILIYGKLGIPALGVTGAALATVLARIVECSIVIGSVHSHPERTPFIKGVYSTLRVPGRLTGQMAKLGAPLLINEFLWAGGMTMLNQVMSTRGLEVVSAENIASTVSNLFFCGFFAMGTTVSIIVGQLLGAGRIEQAVDEDRKLIAFAVALSVVLGVFMAFVSPYIPLIYNTTGKVRSLAADFLVINAVMMPFNAFSNCSYFTLRSGGKTFITFLFDSVYIWVIALPVTYALVHFSPFAIVPIYAISYGIDLIKVLIGFILIKSRIWVNNLVDI